MLTYKSALEIQSFQEIWLRSWNTSFGNVQLSHEIVPNLYSLFFQNGLIIHKFCQYGSTVAFVIPNKSSPDCLLYVEFVFVFIWSLLFHMPCYYYVNQAKSIN